MHVELHEEDFGLFREAIKTSIGMNAGQKPAYKRQETRSISFESVASAFTLLSLNVYESIQDSDPLFLDLPQCKPSRVIHHRFIAVRNFVASRLHSIAPFSVPTRLK